MMHPESLIESSSGIYASRVVVTTGAAVALGSTSEDLTELIVQAHPTNSANVEIGSASVQCWVLEPGDAFNCPIRNPRLLCGKATAGSQTINVIGRKGI
jgi:hypothetical protein